jgi:hypothetical protein
MARRVVPGAYALIAFLHAPALVAQRPEPDLRSCNPGEFAQQSGIPVTAVYLDAGEGLSIGRGGGGAPFVSSLQGSLLWSPSAAARRFAFGPLAGVTYANPRVHGLFGARIRYRVLPFRISQQTDLGLGLDVFADAAWETPSAGLFGLGAAIDLPLDVVVPVNGPRVFTRLLVDTDRDDWRLELGVGIRPWRRLATNPRTPDEPERYRFVISSVQGAVQSGVIRELVDPASPDGNQPVRLCDYTQIRVTDSVLDELRADAARPGSTLTADSLVRRFEDAELATIVLELRRESNTWRDELADAIAAPPPVAEASALSVLAERVRAAISRLYRP